MSETMMNIFMQLLSKESGWLEETPSKHKVKGNKCLRYMFNLIDIL